jgi:hypothetical protein
MHGMGFESWTLWGMGVAAFGALIAIGLALVAQSPRFLKRTGLLAYRLEARGRQFTGYGFALLLLAIGFFLAGVPLGGAPAPVPVAGIDVATPDPAESDANGPNATFFPDAERPSPTPMPVSGAFDAPPASLETPLGEDEAAAEEGATAPAVTPVVTAGLPGGATPTVTPTAAATAMATTTATPAPTLTPTSTPTVTPTPSLTPAPVAGPTATVRSGGNSVWLRRMPGGQGLIMVRHNDTVVLLGGRANHGGTLWQEISTLDGNRGWLPAEFLRID